MLNPRPGARGRALRTSAAGATVLLCATLLATVASWPAGAGPRTASSTPRKIGFGRESVVASDGSHLYVAASEYDLSQLGGIYFFTNKSGTWKQTHVASEPDGSRIKDSQPSITLDPKGHVFIAFVHTKLEFQAAPKVGGISYVTNETGSWVRHEVTSDVNDSYPSIAILGKTIYIAFQRYEPDTNRFALFLHALAPTGSTTTKITGGILEQSNEARPEIVIDGGTPAVVYTRPYDGKEQDCGIWQFEDGHFTLLTAPPAFPQCHDAEGNSNGFSYRGPNLAVEAAGGLHVIFGEPFDPNQTSPYAKFEDLYFSGAQVVTYPLQNGKAQRPNAFAEGKVIHTVWYKGGTLSMDLSKGPDGSWSAGSLTRVTSDPSNQEDLDPAIGSAGGAVFVFFSLDDLNKNSKTYLDSFLYVTRE